MLTNTDSGNPNYSEELAVAVQVWLELACNGIKSGSTPKKDAIEILETHFPEKFDKTKRERIATVINWNKEGGGPFISTKNQSPT